MKTTPPSHFSTVTPTPPDAILGLNTAFRADPSPNKVNLGVGAYRTATGTPYPLPVVRTVIQSLANSPTTNHEYLPQDGLSSFTSAAATLLLGADSTAIAQGRTVSVQALSGTGALRLAFELLRQTHAEAKVFLPVPTWPNHAPVVRGAGFGGEGKISSYRYYDRKRGRLDFEGMIADLEAVPPGSVVVLHACAHNPTGTDPSRGQWMAIRETLARRDAIVIFDVAYQGFATGDVDEDAWAVRLFVDPPSSSSSERLPLLDVIVAQSFAKNMGLYGQRAGVLTFALRQGGECIVALRARLKTTARVMYSSPPRFGAEVAGRVLGDGELRAQWLVELKGMADRIESMRVQLVGALQTGGNGRDWEFLLGQKGMFCYTGLTARQVDYMRDKSHIYMTRDGRISLAGLTEDVVSYVAKAMNAAVAALPHDEAVDG